VVPLTRELDPTAGPLDFFGAEVRRWRTAAGLSQEQLGQKVGYSGAQVGKVETGERAPSQDFAEGCDRALPEACGLFLRLYQLARRWDGGYPSWFTQWVEAERRASTLRTWQPLILPGLLQTPDYARALFLAWRGSDSDAELDELVSARIERQAIFQPPNPPSLWAVIDEGVLRRRIGSAKVMREQLEHLMAVSDRSKITVQVVPADVGAHVGLLGAFFIASFENAPGIVYLESPDEGQTTERPSAVAKITETFDMLRAEALPRAASQDLIRKVAEEQWTT
jgi:transcriptional regulator with XRE-family HTH domain